MKAEITLRHTRLYVRTPYSPALVERFKAVPGRQFHPDDKCWSFPAAPDTLLMVCDACGVLPWMLGDDVKAACGGSVAMPQSPPVDLAVIDGHEFLTEPYEHQRVGLARLLTYDRWIVADEQGCGKSFILANRIKRLPEGSRTLIVCPKSVVDGWRDQLCEHIGQFGTVVSGTRTQKIRAIREPGLIKITNYETVLTLFDELDTIKWDCIVNDECHKIKNFCAQTSKAVRKLNSQAKYVYALSGTPAPNSLVDWHGVVAAVRPDLMPTTKTAFEARYCTKSEIQPGIWKVSGYRNVQELHGLIASCTSRYTKAECLDLPPKVYVDRHAHLEGEQARLYRDLKKDAVARIVAARDEGTLTIKNVLQESLRLLQVVGGFFPDDDGHIHELHPKAKVQALADALEEAGERQVVVWCAFRAEAHFLMGWLGKLGRTVGFTGETPGDERTAALEAFKGGDAQYFVGTAASGGTGINGLEKSDTEVYYSRDYNYATWSQSQDRLHRIGQRNVVTVVKLLARGTVDDRVDAELDRKGTLQELLLTRPEEMF